MAAYYNEWEPYPAQWTRNLITAGHLAPGVVDERSIRDLTPTDVRAFRQCHFFAGIGVWSAALRLAGIGDDASVWTGSCPCQPFSIAGNGGGLDDERHLWPAWFGLIRECRPAIIFGEQVASAAGLAWFDAVQHDLEGAGYAVGGADLGAASVGAPHIRQRLYFVAVLDGARRDWMADHGCQRRGVGGTSWLHEDRERGGDADGRGQARGIPDAARERREGADAEPARTMSRDRHGLGDASRDGDREHARELPGDEGEHEFWAAYGRDSSVAPGATRGFWSDAEWIPCRDGKHRPIEPGTPPLVTGATARVGRLRATGNSITRHVAAAFIRCAIEALTDPDR